eukprot:276741_1
MSPFTYPTISSTTRAIKSLTIQQATTEYIKQFKSASITNANNVLYITDIIASYFGATFFDTVILICLFTFLFYCLTSALHRVDIGCCNLFILMFTWIGYHSVSLVFGIESVEGNISCGDTIYGQLEPGGDMDYFQFVLPPHDGSYAVTISTCGSDVLNTVLRLYDANSQYMGMCDNCGSCGSGKKGTNAGKEIWDIPQLASGEFFVRISGDTRISPSYKLSITCTPTYSPTYLTNSPTNSPTYSP